MDWQINKTGGIPPIPICNYVCESCRHNTGCLIYAFEVIGKKLNESADGDCENYGALLKDIQINLDRTIESVRKRAMIINQESAVPSGSSNRRNPDFPPVMLLTREFAERVYELIQDIRSREEISLEILGHLRELQFHHTFVMTEICRAIAGLLSDKPTEDAPGAIAQGALKSLRRCVNALMAIVQIMPGKNDEVMEILDVSSRIECEIQLQFL